MSDMNNNQFVLSGCSRLQMKLTGYVLERINFCNGRIACWYQWPVDLKGEDDIISAQEQENNSLSHILLLATCGAAIIYEWPTSSRYIWSPMTMNLGMRCKENLQIFALQTDAMHKSHRLQTFALQTNARQKSRRLVDGGVVQ
ncbi:hypothetical protein CCR75_001267 [Bremia lactucae]|uniref:Uncharacterized protein n=1 Tax=Bremia lactucae TaxID=4779 RepID=A0A976IIL0_BRELC|nr:hypothetical protein CCR75_001267 [Bremia lactucae]